MAVIGLKHSACSVALERPQASVAPRRVPGAIVGGPRQAQASTPQAVVRRHEALCRGAFQAKNYPEAIEHCSRILEVAPGNAEAWMEKGIATACLCTEACDRSDKAVRCLRQAASITGDPRLLSQIDLFLIALRYRWHVKWAYPEVTFDGGTPFEFVVKLWHGKREAESSPRTCRDGVGVVDPAGGGDLRHRL